MKLVSLTAAKTLVAWLKKGCAFLVWRGELIALGLLIATVSLINVVWILQDTRPQPGADPNHYLTNTFEFVDRLNEQGSTQLWSSVAELSVEGRPPLYQILSVPFVYLFGRSEDAALAVNLLFGAILLLATYGIGRLTGNGRLGLLAALFVATSPPIVNLLRIYRPHAALPACVALSLSLLLLLLKTRCVAIAWLFGASLGFGMLIHLNFLYLLPIPAVVFGLYMLLFQTAPRLPPSLSGAPGWLLGRLRDPFALCGLLPAALIGAGLAVSWYLPQSQAIFALRQAVIANWSRETYGFLRIAPSFWWYALTAPGAMSYVFVFLVGVGLVHGLIECRLGPSVLVITFLAMYTGLGLRLGDLGWLHFTAALPVVAVLSAMGVVGICRLSASIKAGLSWVMRSGEDVRRSGLSQIHIGRLLSATVIMVFLGAATFNFSVVTWGVQPWSRAVALALGAPLDSGVCFKRMNLAYCPDPARGEDWHVSDILRAIVEDPECQDRECSLVVVPKLESFNSFVLDYHLLRDFPQARDRIRVSGADEWGGQPGSGEWVVSDYVVYIPGWHEPDGDRRWETRVAMTQFLEAPPPAFADVHREVASFALPGDWAASLFKRTEAFAFDMAVENYEAALKAVPSDVMLYEKLGYLYVRAENWSRAEGLFRQAAQVAPALSWPYRALGDLYHRQERDDQAVVELWRAIETEPFDQRAYHYLADLLQAQGDFQDAVGVYELAARNNPRFVWPHLALGSLCVQENRLAEAEAAYRRASRIEPWNQTVQANLPDVHWSWASSLGTAQAYTDQTPLIWWRGEAWVRPQPYAPDVMVGRSVLAVEGRSRPDQIHLHPFGADQDTYLRFDVESCHYDTLQIGYGLADQVASLSNGVRYTLRASADGGSSDTVLWDETVTDNVWKSKTVPLALYWGEDVAFQLVVGALGDDAHDWLQTTVRLYPAQNVWDLATNLATVQVAALEGPLSWNGSSAWVDGDGRPMVAISQAPVQGARRDNQVQFHPCGSQQATSVTLVVEDNPYSMLRTRYALADEAIGRSDGVDYAIKACTNGGTTCATLLEEEVLQNVWNTALLDLIAYTDQDLTVELTSSSRGDETYDWLQITLDLFVTRGAVQDPGKSG